MAEDCALSVGAKILEYLVRPVLITPFRPIFCFKSFVDDFHREREYLRAKKERVENAVTRANHKALQLDQHIHKWLEVTIKVMEDGQILQNKLEEIGSCCFSGAKAVENGQVEMNKSHCCSLGWTFRYQLSKRVREHTDSVKEHCRILDESRDLVSHPIDIRQCIVLPQYFMFSESANSAFLAVMEALVEDRVNKIGLYSVGGTGKTTLLKLVSKEAERFKIFDQIVMVTVPQNLEMIRQIQGRIADFLSLTLEQKAKKEERANCSKYWKMVKNSS